jgi:hypothetical protein
MDHGTTHRPGTDSGCIKCRALAYEPGWYASLCALVVIDELGSVPVHA